MNHQWPVVRRFHSWLLMFGSFSATADEVSVAVAANFAAPMEHIATRFTQDTGDKLVISYGATGKFYAQIKNGAPFEVFLSADQKHPQKLIQEKQAIPGSEFTYAIGKLVLWSPKPNQVNHYGDVLKSSSFKHLAMANPKLAPYGIAAKEVLEKGGFWDRYQDRLVLGENITQAHQFVATGNAELGFVALSQIKKQGKELEGSFWMIPQKMYSPLKQQAVLLKRGKESAAAKRFVEYLKSDKARTIIQEFGYELQKSESHD